jgi:hypothetical protein
MLRIYGEIPDLFGKEQDEADSQYSESAYASFFLDVEEQPFTKRKEGVDSYHFKDAC